MRLGLLASLARRESRGARGRVLFFTLSLAVGVAAVVAVAGLASALDGSIRGEARQLLAADLVVEGTRPIPPEVESAAASISGARLAHLREMPTVVAPPAAGEDPPPSRIVELKAVEGGYPFYGSVRVDPPETLPSLLDPEGCVVGPELLSGLGLGVGDALKIGDAEFRIRGTVLSEPDRIAVGFALGPRVFVSLDGLERAGLARFGSRVEHRLLVALPEGTGAEAVRGAAERLARALPPGGWHRVETFTEAQPALREGLRRAERFLGLVALLSLLVGGIGVAQSVRAWIAGRMDAIAVLKCLGLRPRETAVLYLAQTAGLALVGSALGALAGSAVLATVPLLLEGIVPAGAIDPIQPRAILRGLALGVGVALAFGLAPLSAARRVPPLRVLRRDAEPIRWSARERVLTWGAVFGGILATASAQSRSLALGLGFTLGIGAAVGLLSLAAVGLSRLLGGAPRRAARVWIRHGLGALARPGSGTLGAIVAVGLGVLVVLGMALVEHALSERLRADLPKDAPTVFLVDVQPDQLDGVRGILEGRGGSRFDAVPIVTARLLALDGRRAADLAAEEGDSGRGRWVLTREQRLTSLETLPEGNVVVEGALWSDPARHEVSIERDFALDLGASIGSTVTLDVQGVPVDLLVTSLRTVDWGTFGINFFLVVEPGALDDAPQQRVAAAKIPDGREQEVQDALAAAYPNVTMIRVREIMERVLSVLERVGLAVRLLGGFTVLAGVGILAGAVGATTARRGREVALLKSLGMTRRGVVLVFSVEYALVGAVAGAIGAAGAGLLSWAVLTHGMEIEWAFRVVPYAAAIAGAILLTVVAGVAASARALSSRPVEVLRRD